MLDKLLFHGRLKDGFFVEAGSQDGETHSNTLHFEVDPDNCHLTELGFS